MAASKRFLDSYSYFTPRIFMIPQIYRNQTVAATSGIPHLGYLLPHQRPQPSGRLRYDGDHQQRAVSC